MLNHFSFINDIVISANDASLRCRLRIIQKSRGADRLSSFDNGIIWEPEEGYNGFAVFSVVWQGIHCVVLLKLIGGLGSCYRYPM